MPNLAADMSGPAAKYFPFTNNDMLVKLSKGGVSEHPQVLPTRSSSITEIGRSREMPHTYRLTGLARLKRAIFCNEHGGTLDASPSYN